MDMRERRYLKALVDAGMGGGDARALVALRAERSIFTSDWDVRTLNAGVPGGVLLEWARADVPFAHAPEALENGGRLDDLLELTPDQAGLLTHIAPFAAHLDVRLTDVAALLEVVPCQPITAIRALAVGFSAADLLAANALGADFTAGYPDSDAWDVPDGCTVAAAAGPSTRSLALVLVTVRGVNMEAALAIAAGCTDPEAQVVARLVLDGQLLPDAVSAAKALLRDSPVPAERTPQVRVKRGVDPAGR